MISFNRVKILSVVSKLFTLPDRRLIVDVPYTLYQSVIERDYSCVDTFLQRLPNHVSRLVINLVFPPVFIVGDRQHRNAVTIDVIVEARSCVGGFLKKRKEVRSDLSLFQLRDKFAWHFYEFVVLRFESGGSNESALYDDLLTSKR